MTAAPVSLNTIVAAVAVQFRVPVPLIRSSRRDRHIAVARQAVFLLARELTPHSLPQIGRLVGARHHTTVLSGARAILRRVEKDPDVAAALDALRAVLGTPDRRVYIGWVDLISGEGGCCGTPLAVENAAPLIERLRAEGGRSFAYEFLPAVAVQRPVPGAEGGS